MTIREDIVTSAVSFLQDPNVVSSPIENKLSFLRSKNLSQEEIDAAFARTGISPAPAATSQPASGPIQQQPYQGQYQPQPYGWQPPPPEPPKRDWRDWFIMATVVGGVGYGLYFMTKRYLYPLVAPPTPEKLEQDKTLVDEQFEKAFATIEQLAKDTEALKSSEKERTEKLDKVLEELETFMRDTKSAGRRQDDETEILREEMRTLKNIIPKSMTANKEFTDGRLKEISNEVKSLKSLVGQRMNPSNPASSSNANGYRRPASDNNATPASPAAGSPALDTSVKENRDAAQAAQEEIAPKNMRQDYISSLGGRSSPFSVGAPSGKASIPAWQLAASKSADGPSGSQQEAGSSS
ncbi:peroxisomal membrane anchor protein conserved region-domain-containing protein [Xylariaceae sp. FL0662B]|nr:peroxisomal membrane anchor protein conserved region-domain-containing protein [Xylariaceae sp. FL0662B]